MKKNALDPEPYNMTEKDKEAVNLLLETLETCNVKVNQVIICVLCSLGVYITVTLSYYCVGITVL